MDIGRNKLREVPMPAGSAEEGASSEADSLARQADQRISDSLQLLADVLRTQAEHAGPGARAELEGACRRVLVIGKLHRQLSQSAQTGAVALDDYLQSVGEDLTASLTDSSPVLLVNVDDLRVPSRVAAVFGLVVHELVVDALKHEFTKDGGIIEVACGTNPEGGITLEITHNGSGSGGGGRQGPGAILVSSLISEVGAKVAIENAHPGVCCRIVLPASEIV